MTPGCMAQATGAFRCEHGILPFVHYLLYPRSPTTPPLSLVALRGWTGVMGVNAKSEERKWRLSPHLGPSVPTTQEAEKVAWRRVLAN